jgi:hypothetical protein
MFPTAYEFAVIGIAKSATKAAKNHLRVFPCTAAVKIRFSEIPLSHGVKLALLRTSTNPHHDAGRSQKPDHVVRKPDGRALWQNCFR